MVVPFIIEKTFELIVNGAIKSFKRKKLDTPIPYIGQRFSLVKSIFDDNCYFNAVVLDVIESTVGDDYVYHIAIEWSESDGDLTDMVESDELDDLLESNVEIDFDDLDIYDFDDVKMIAEHYEDNVAILLFDYHEWYE